MLNPSKLKQIVSFTLTITFILSILCTSYITVQAEPPSEIQAKLAGITEEEKKILQNLFTLAQEIAVLEREEEQLAEYIDAKIQEIKYIEAAISVEEISQAEKQEALKQVLKSYQRLGPGSYLEIIMDSDSLTTLLKRINTLRDLTRNTGRLLEQLEQSKDRLSSQKSKLAESLALMKEKQQKSLEAIAEKQKLKEEKELYLASLKGEQQAYEKYLADIQQMWEDLKPFFSQAAREFSDLVKAGGIPQDAVKISFSFFNIKGSIEESVFNEIVSKGAALSEMNFTFHPDKLEMKLPNKNLALSGSFVIVEGNVLKLQVQEGSFYGMPLEPGSIEELFSEGDLLLDFKSVLGRSTLKAIEIKEGYLELYIR